MGSHVLEHIPLPAEIFHELAGQLDGIPFHAGNTRDIAFIDLREHVVQTVAGFVEQGDHVIVREQRGLAVHAGCEIADQMGHGRLQLMGVGAQPTRAHIVHPGAAALALARLRVEIELADQLWALCAGALDAVELHAGVPDRSFIAADGDFEQGLDNLEQAGQHLGGWKVLLELLLAEGVAGFLELFADEGPVPGLGVGNAELSPGKGAQIGHVLFGIGAGTLCQIAQKVNDLLGRVGHLGHDRDFAEVAVAQQLGFFQAQREDFLHHGGVVKALAVALGLVGGPGHISLIDLFAQCAALGKLHHRQIAGHLKRQLVAFLAIGFGAGFGRGDHIGRNAVQLVNPGVVGKGIGGVQRVLAEFLGQLGRAGLNLRKAFLGSALQFGAREHKAAHGMVPCGALFLVEAGRVNGLVLGVQAFIGAQIGPEFGDLGQGFVIGRAQLRGVGNAVEVIDGRPGSAQLFSRHVQHGRDGLPLCGEVRCNHGLQRLAGTGQQSVDGGCHIRRLNAVKQGQGGGFEKWIAHAVLSAGKVGKIKRSQGIYCYRLHSVSLWSEACSRQDCVQAPPRSKAVVPLMRSEPEREKPRGGSEGVSLRRALPIPWC